jgi:8-oxo-dGTP pyrophosphatase MutT (NUDIX family)
LRFLGDFSYYAVAVPVYRDSFLFEVRAENISQPLEVSFPGGRIEEFETPKDAALRELREEICITNCRLIRDLEPLITPFNTVIFPFLVSLDTNELRVNSEEVKETFLVPIDNFGEPYAVGYVNVELRPREDFPFSLIPYGEDYPWKKGVYKVFFYKYNNYVIWGLTARIAQRAYEVLRKSET